MPLSPSSQALADQLPLPLRELLDAELAAGNGIAEIGHSFPAPPRGAYFKLTQPLLTHTRKFGSGLVYRERQSSMYSGEITDAERYYFLLEPPLPPEPQPTMDAIRAARLPVRRVPPSPPIAVTVQVPGGYRVEVDCRGEMLTYQELHRSAHVICTFGGPCTIVGRTLSNWNYADGRSERMSAAEKAEVLTRIADYCRQHHRMDRLTFET